MRSGGNTKDYQQVERCDSNFAQWRMRSWRRCPMTKTLPSDALWMNTSR